jgi:hypothetical protein
MSTSVFAYAGAGGFLDNESAYTCFHTYLFYAGARFRPQNSAAERFDLLEKCQGSWVTMKDVMFAC